MRGLLISADYATIRGPDPGVESGEVQQRGGVGWGHGAGEPRGSSIWDAALVVGLVAAAALIRSVELWGIPIWTDEGNEVRVAVRFVRGGSVPLTNSTEYNGPLFNYLLAAAFWLFGMDPWLPRELMVALGALTLVPTYLLARELAAGVGGDGRIAGAIAAALLGVNAVHVVVNSHVSWGNSTTPLFTTTGVWLLARALRLRGPPTRRAGVSLMLAGLFFGLALQTHPSVVALLPGVLVAMLWRSPAWLRSPWPYASALAFLVGQAPTIVHNIHSGGLVWLDAAERKQALYNFGDEQDGASYFEWLGRLIHTLGASVAGLINDRDTPFPEPWHPALLFTLALAMLCTIWMWRRGQPMPALLTLSFVLMLPLVNGKYAPLVSNARYVGPLQPILFACIGAWAASVHLGREGRSVRIAMVAAILGMAAVSLSSLAAFYAEAEREERTNHRLIAAYERMMVSYRLGETVFVDEGMYRDWSLTEGRLQRIFAYWLEIDDVPHRLVDVQDDGRFDPSVPEGSLAILARRSVPEAGQLYALKELASDADPDAEDGTGYSIVRLKPRR